MTTTLQTKRCPRCGETKPRSGFYQSQRRPDGLEGYCKPCRVILNRVWQITERPRWELSKRWKGRVVTTETDLRDALTRPEPFYAIPQPKGTPAHV